MEATRSDLASGITPPRSARTPLLIPGPPSPASRRILVVVTVDAERYTPVDLTDVLDEGAVIRSRILNKLRIWDGEDQALIYETEIGALAIGEPLTDQSLSEICHERGDSRASLAFIVQRPPPPRFTNVQTPQYQANFDATSEAFNAFREPRQQNHSHIVNEQQPSAPLTSNGHRPDGLRSPPHRTTRPRDITVEGHGSANLDEPQPRRVRPLPAIPTPTSSPNSGSPMANDPYSNIQALANEFDDLYDYAPALAPARIQVEKPDCAGGVQRSEDIADSRTKKLELPKLSLPGGQSAARGQSAGTSSPYPATPVKWVRGELIGKGKYGRVYLALDTTKGKIIAVKQIEIPEDRPGSRSLLEALKSESELLRTLDHRNIVKYIHFEEAGTFVNILMEYIPGGTLGSTLREFGPLSDNVTKFVMTQILDGLEYLHSRKVLHRDLKADNILVQTDGTCKISDFAISKHADNEGLVFTALQGSLFWMAPEVIDTKQQGYNAKVDIWSLGCLVLEMWTDARPWTGLDAVSVMFNLYQAKQPPPLPKDFMLTDVARDFYNKCFAMDPTTRPSAAQLQGHPYLVLPKDWRFLGFEEQPIESPIASASTRNPTHAPSPILLESPNLFPQITLGSFRRYSSAVDKPVDCLNANRADLTEYISQSNLHFNAQTECTEWACSSILFPRLTIFSYEAIYDLSDLQTWKSWDIITSLYRFKEISDRLRSFFADTDEVVGLKEVVALDVDTICIRLLEVVSSAEKYRRIVELRGDEAQSMLDLFQTLLDLPSLDAVFRSPFMNALLRLSRRSGLYPHLLLQNQVSLEGTDAVAAGQFGDVWKGKFQDKQVAVKVLKVYVTSDLTKHFKKVFHETLIWRQLRHTNVLPFLCLHHVNNNQTRVGLVSPWMDNGNVQSFLRRVHDVNRISLIIDIVEGLEYLHTMQPSIVHGDLKAVNILITDTHRACLADFGLSTASDSQVLRLSSFSSGQTGGTSRWTAPELLDGSQATNTRKSDVYAFACVCYEIFSGNIPFHDVNSDYPVIIKVMQGQRPPRPSHCEPWTTACASLGLDDSLWNVVERCWRVDPNKRPSMSNVLKSVPPRADLPRPGAEQYLRPLGDLQRLDLITWAGHIA